MSFGAEVELGELFSSAGLSRSALAACLKNGSDSLGDAFMRRYSPYARRASGSVFTPVNIVDDMVAHVADFNPDTVVDCGCGSGRFAIAASRVFPHAHIVAIDSSSLACEMCLLNARAAGVSDRVEVVQADFLEYSLPAERRGRVLWIGNPPYVRHHELDAKTKEWLKDAAHSFGLEASGLSGLHIYFLAKIASLWHSGDRGILITSAEWLDVNYGSFARKLLTEKLDLDGLVLFDRDTRVFELAESTAVAFSFGSRSDKISVRCAGRTSEVSVEELRLSDRWSDVLREPDRNAERDGKESVAACQTVKLGDLAVVHRGVVTGNNKFWVRSANELNYVPKSLTVPIVAHAREITGDCKAQNDPSSLARIIALPENIETLNGEERVAAKRVIEEGLSKGINNGYVASHRKAWWSIKLPEAPSIMMTYMARRPPTFVVNERKLPMLNVVHGIYPKQPMSAKALHRLANYLNANVARHMGRTYCGGLTKFEPKEAEALRVPSLEVLEA